MATRTARKIFGFWKVQIFNVYYYIREARNQETLQKFAPDLSEDRWDRLIFSWGWSGLGLGDRPALRGARLLGRAVRDA